MEKKNNVRYVRYKREKEDYPGIGIIPIGKKTLKKKIMLCIYCIPQDKHEGEDK